MIPEEEGGCDYSYPASAPRHIATKISQMGYQLKYHEYFGGAVLFTKEQVEATNGYSNDYWDWGMEDDDLFWRCYKEGLTENTYLIEEPLKQKYYSFNGENSHITIPFTRETRGLTSKSHTISVLVRAFQQPDKNKIFLIGDSDNRYVEYPIFRLPGYDYGISFNNSRALSFTFWNTFHNHNYMWVKRYDNQWSWVTAVVNEDTKTAHFYLNGSEVDARAGYGSTSPMTWTGKLKNYGPADIQIGMSPNTDLSTGYKYFKGDVAKVYAWNRALSPDEVKNLHRELPTQGNVINLDFNSPVTEFINNEAELKEEEFKVPNSILPFRVDGKMRCLPHKDEGIVDGKFAKGETTARNERRYVLQMQQDKLNYKQDGIKQVEYELVKETQLTPWAKMIDIKL